MGVPRQIAEHLFWSAEWGFGVDHPFLIFQGRDQPLKANPAGQFAKDVKAGKYASQLKPLDPKDERQLECELGIIRRAADPG